MPVPSPTETSPKETGCQATFKAQYSSKVRLPLVSFGAGTEMGILTKHSTLTRAAVICQPPCVEPVLPVALSHRLNAALDNIFSSSWLMSSPAHYPFL